MENNNNSSNISEKSRLTAFLLAFFLGMFGVHRMYVGKIASGIVQLLLTISIIGILFVSIWVLIDWIFILTGEFKDKESKYLKKW